MMHKKVLFIFAAGMICSHVIIAVVFAQEREMKLDPNERISSKDGVCQVYVPSGEFVMGVDDFETPYENTANPPHLEKITKGFWMDKFEVTNEYYVKYLNDSIEKEKLATIPQLLDFAYAMLDIDHPLCGISLDEKNKRYKVKTGMENLPVMPVTWTGAYRYSVAKGKALPTEAQWEYAARGVNNFKYPWGNEWHADWTNVSTKKLALVGSFPKDISSFGIMDMAGNAREWVLDRFVPDYYAESPNENPLDWISAEKSDYRVIRGGCFAFTEWDSRTTSRGYRMSSAYPVGTGFRCVESDSQSARHN
jgi:formylglycine-generating enzyme required for sulfatase activity